IDFLVTCINWWLGDGSNKVGIATICEIRRIGKTTIAKVVCNLNIQKFESFSFLIDVRETTQERNGLILKGKVNKIHNLNDGITKIKEALHRKRSKIIITSRHRCLLSDPFIRHMFDFEASSTYGDLCKLSMNPFNFLIEHARSVVKHYGGLPLAFQVLGYSLPGKSINAWRSALEKLKVIPDSKIQKIIRICYDSLQDNHDNSIFLDIACVFVGKDRDYTTTILDGCDYCTTIGIENLINRSLLVVNEKNKLMMHQMIRDTGRNIIHYVKLKGDYSDFPRCLIWLCWHGFPQDYLLTNLDISSLVVLEMRNSSLKRVWNDTKILNLSHSHSLLKILNLSSLHSLERLMLKDCIKFTEVDQSIGEVKTLTVLNLKSCKSLKKLPRTIGSLESLKELILIGCSTFNDMPRDLQNMKSLRVLSLDGTAIYESNSWLSWLSLNKSKELGFFWATLPYSLVKLSLESCRLFDDVMPSDLSYLPSLKP
ncbi:hypothetical protein QQP08_020114, partial [Theobroma cacao]